MQPAPESQHTRIWTSICLAAILGLGGILRFYHLGYNSYWLDEAGVAYAANASSLAKMLEVVRSHVLAMPLDYLIVWLVGRVSTQEFALRIPAALWGIGSLFLAYKLYRRFVSPLPALIGLFIFSLSPLHIQYSQELRFYSSFVFFYLLSTLLLWDALEQTSQKRWVIFTITCLIGIYFHPYVLFTLANGIVWLALRPQNNAQARLQRTRLMFSVIICLLAFLGGYLIFSASNTFKIPLMVFEDTPVEALATGLGWLPFYAGLPAPSWLWGAVCAILEVIGIGVVLKASRRSPLAGLFYSLLLQLAAVIAADLLQHYFFAPRQLLMLLPLWCLFAGIGVHSAANSVTARIQAALGHQRPALVHGAMILLVVSLLAAASIPAIQAYEQDDKGNTRSITEIVIQQWQPGDTYIITPAYDGFVYKYYIEDVYQRTDIASRLFTADWQNILTLKDQGGSIFLITPYRLTDLETRQLRELGFRMIYHSYPQSRYAKTLWVLPKST